MEAEAQGYLFPDDVSGLASSCTDGAQFYLRETDNALEARFYLFKDGHPVSYWREHEGDDSRRPDWRLFSVVCRKHVILLWGEGGTSTLSFALTSRNGKPVLIMLGSKYIGSIKESEGKTTVRAYQDKDHGEMVEYTFTEPFRIAEQYKHPKETGDLWPTMKLTWYSSPLTKDTGLPLAMKATCYHDGIEIRAEAWRTGEGIARLRIPINDTEHTLSFLPTSGLCWEGKMILHGQKDGKPATAIVESRKDEPKSGEEHIVTTISEVDPVTVPLSLPASEVR